MLDQSSSNPANYLEYREMYLSVLHLCEPL
jgi:hypothetical protein